MVHNIAATVVTVNVEFMNIVKNSELLVKIVYT